MIFKRVIYLGYYFKELDWSKLNKFLSYVKDKYNISKLKLWNDIIYSTFKYNISIMDYFFFKFYEMTSIERKKYAGTGYMYEYQLLMNPKENRHVLENKIMFNNKYAKFITHKSATKSDFFTDNTKAQALLHNKSGRLILKSSDGQCGEGIVLVDLNKVKENEVIERLKNTQNDLIEEFIIQHDDLMKLSPSGLNTVRIFTQLDKNDNVVILGARLRITIDSYIDNLAAGNIAASINVEGGIVDGHGVYSDITKNEEEFHPLTNMKIKGFKIPYWDESLKMVKEAALWQKDNRSIGWDVAITNEGPELLEGNHNWCKLLWQLPVKKGLKKELEVYLK